MLKRGWVVLTVSAIVGLALAASAQAAVKSASVSAGALRATLSPSPWELSFTDSRGRPVLVTRPGSKNSADGTFGFQVGGKWYHATKATSIARSGSAVKAILATNDPARRTITVTVSRDADGIIAVTSLVSGADVAATAAAFVTHSGERFLGFGERANAVDQSGKEVKSFVSDGPWLENERDFMKNIIPAAGLDSRDDSTYYPIPWLLSTAGFGVLSDNDQNVVHRLGSETRQAWSVEASAQELKLRVFAGPKPADVLRRMSARLGRQPRAAAPFFFGPWFQSAGSAVEGAAAMKAADAPISLMQTYAHWLPCGMSAASRENDLQQLTALHSAGLAVTTYFNPMICTSNQPAFDQAAAAGALGKDASGGAYKYIYTTSRQFPVGQFDFSSAAGIDFFGKLLGEAYDAGHDGWMEDFGEYTPQDIVSADGTPGNLMHNRYPVLYHGAGYKFASSKPRPLARFNRSGWTGSAKYSQAVWGGDPTTDWGYDGLASAVRDGLTMGLSGVSLWGSDIGGFFSITSTPQTTPELLRRWIQFGAVSGLMRNEADGIQIATSGERAQPLDPDVLPVWRRYAKLRTQLYPYLSATEAEYDRSGMPIMRHLALTDPSDQKATARDDEFGFGPDLLAAPVLKAGATSRSLYVPKGTWIDFWRSVAYNTADGSFAVKATKALAGGRQVTLPAPADELPLLAKAGAVIPMLPADVETLSDYGSGIVHLSDRLDHMHLLAFPSGSSSAALGAGSERVTSTEAKGKWTLQINGSRSRTFTIDAGLGALSSPLKVCSVAVNGVKLPATAWKFDAASKTLRATVTATKATVVASGC